MPIDKPKKEAHSLIDGLLMETHKRAAATGPHLGEGLAKEDCEELHFLASEPDFKDTISYEELTSSLRRWFTK